MGAVGICEEIEAASLDAAYREAYNTWECNVGTGPYNGTITTTTGVVDKTDVLEKLVKEKGQLGTRSLSDADSALSTWIEEAYNNTEKWGVVWGAKIADNKYILVGWAAE